MYKVSVRNIHSPIRMYEHPLKKRTHKKAITSKLTDYNIFHSNLEMYLFVDQKKNVSNSLNLFIGGGDIPKLKRTTKQFVELSY